MWVFLVAVVVATLVTGCGSDPEAVEQLADQEFADAVVVSLNELSYGWRVPLSPPVAEPNGVHMRYPSVDTSGCERLMFHAREFDPPVGGSLLAAIQQGVPGQPVFFGQASMSYQQGNNPPGTHTFLFAENAGFYIGSETSVLTGGSAATLTVAQNVEAAYLYCLPRT